MPTPALAILVLIGFVLCLGLGLFLIVKNALPGADEYEAGGRHD